MSIALAVACAPQPATPRDDPPASATVVAVAAVEVETAPAEPVRREHPPQEPSLPATASWYGPGMWGNRTACGHTLTDALLGVAHRTLPCGTLVTLRYGIRTVTVPVVDRGPYVESREFDLTHAARVALTCPDLCSLSWVR